MLAQCPVCSAIKIEIESKYVKFVWQKSIAQFNSLPLEKCYECGNKISNWVQEKS